MTQQTKVAAARELASDPLVLIDAVHILKNRIADTVGPNEGIEFSLSKDGNSFDLAVALPMGDSGERAKLMLENNAPEGVAFTAIDVRDSGRINRRRLTAQVVAPAQIITRHLVAA